MDRVAKFPLSVGCDDQLVLGIVRVQKLLGVDGHHARPTRKRMVPQIVLQAEGQLQGCVGADNFIPGDRPGAGQEYSFLYEGIGRVDILEEEFGFGYLMPCNKVLQLRPGEEPLIKGRRMQLDKQVESCLGGLELAIPLTQPQ